MNPDASPIGEAYPSTSAESLPSKAEVRSLKSALTTRNRQPRTAIERASAAADDLRNLLDSVDLAILFLDANLELRLFSPAARRLFGILPRDIGRPLAGLRSLGPGGGLIADARAVLANFQTRKQDIRSDDGSWFVRTVRPYRAHDGKASGVVITFTDITERRNTEEALERARQLADVANLAKSRFLASASHDLRQPLQTIALLQDLLAKAVEGDRARELVSRLDEAVAAISGMLNALLDISQIEAGVVLAEPVDFPVGDLFERLRDEFSYHAQAHGLRFRLAPCSLSAHTDPRLLEQIIRNLLTNALKYTKNGGVLLGCRRRRDALRIEVWDTGIGMAESKLRAIFDDHRHFDDPARERGGGLGLGLAIVQRLGALLDLPVGVRSHPGNGSVFTIVVPRPHAVAGEREKGEVVDAASQAVAAPRRAGRILIIEDDPEVRDLLELMLQAEGYQTTTAQAGDQAFDLVARDAAAPDLILADYNLPGGMDGLGVAARLRRQYDRQIPVIVLTGDVSTDAQRDIGARACIQLARPVKSDALIEAIDRLLPIAARAQPTAPAPVIPPDESARSSQTASIAETSAAIFIVDDDRHIREAIRALLEDDGRTVEDFATAEAFLAADQPGRTGLLLIDAYLPGMSGLELLARLDHRLPAIMITGASDVQMAVTAMKAGASDFIEKPMSGADLIASIDRALDQARDQDKRAAWRQDATAHLAGLTPRQREIMDMVLAGQPSKNIAADLGISQRTVENHRAAIMKKTGAKSIPGLARLALAAADPPVIR